MVLLETLNLCTFIVIPLLDNVDNSCPSGVICYLGVHSLSDVPISGAQGKQ